MRHRQNAVAHGRRKGRGAGAGAALSALLLAAGLAGSGAASAGVLGDLLRDTLANPSVAAQRSQREAADKELASASAGYFGSGAATAENSTFESSRFLGVLNPGGFANPDYARTQTRYGANYMLPVDLFGVIAANRAAARQSLAAAELALRQETLMKLHQTAGAWAELQAVDAQAEALRLQRARVAATVERVGGEVGAGSLAVTDLKLAQSELARVESDQVRLDGQREQTLAALEEAAGRRPPPGGGRMAIPAWHEADAGGTLPQQLAGARAQAADLHARSQRRALWPAVAVGADYYGYDGGGHNQDTWSVGARLSIPLDIGAHLRDSAEQARADAARSDSLAAANRARSQLAALKAGYDAARADIAALEKEVDYRTEVVSVQKELASVGAETVESAMRRERDLFEAQARLAQARAQAVTAWSAAQVVLGTSPEVFISELDAP
ncbi:MAG: TolC family protein [Nevskia sp.]|nr:TolC family protein [Nevskia sp.]